MIEAEALKQAVSWDLQPAEEPFDLEVGEAERAEIVALYRWFSRFSPMEKLRMLARHQRLARRLSELRGAGRR